jgi:glycosyltransferase involved in cell wall biosynthesis
MSKIYVISTGRNVGNFSLKCAESIQEQTLKPYKHIFIDDNSDDDSLFFLERLENVLDNFELIKNKERKYRLRNIYENAVNKDPEDIICVVDSDDWLNNPDALKIIKNEYDNNPGYEYVYSRYVLSHGPLGGSKPIPNKEWHPYKNDWITTHISTFKAKALQRVPIDNMYNWEGDWFKIATDRACVLPMLYMLKQRDGDYSSVGFIDNPLYTYRYLDNNNTTNPVTEDGRKLAALSIKTANYISQRGFIER